MFNVRPRWALRLLALICLLAESVLTAAADWPTYLHDESRTAASEDTTLTAAAAPQLIRLWAFKTGGAIAASATVVAGVVYVGSWDGYEYALNAVTGAQIWKTYLGQTASTNDGCFPQAAGISSAAAVQNGVVYVGGGDAYWYALDAATGTVLWKVYTGDNSTAGGHYNWSSPLIVNGFAYIGIASFGDCPLVQGQLLQVSLTTQQVVNTFNVVPNGQVGGGIWTSPAYDPATNAIFVTTGTKVPGPGMSQSLIALDATSLRVESYWQLPDAWATTDSDFGSSPILFTDATNTPMVAAINKNGYVYAFRYQSEETSTDWNLSDGPVWRVQVANPGACPACGDGTVSSAAFAGGRLFVAGGNGTLSNGVGYAGTVRALDPTTGAVLWEHGAPALVLPALATVNGLVLDGAGATLEVLDAGSGTRLYSYPMPSGATLYAPASVSNGTIYVGSTDGTLSALGVPTSAPPPPPPDPTCPSGWICQDLGAPAVAGSETSSGANWAVTAGGSPLGSSSSDQGRLLAQSVSGDVQVSAQIAALSGSGTQAGVLVRQSSDPTAPFYGVFLSAGGSVTVLTRTAFGNRPIASVQLPGTAPLFLEVQRMGDHFEAATSPDGVTYTLIPGSSALLPLPAATLAGVAVNAGSSGATGGASIVASAVGAPGSPPVPVVQTPCPAGWSCADVGNPTAVGTQVLSGTTWTVQGAGQDLAGNADQFHFVWQPVNGDSTVSAHLSAQSATNSWAKAGVMVRQSAAADAPYYGVFLTPGNGIVVQDRVGQAYRTQVLTHAAGTVPGYLEVARTGNQFTAYTSTDGITWVQIPGSTTTVALPAGLLDGMVVTSHGSGLSTAAFDTVTLTANGCPLGWTCADIGNPYPVGFQQVVSSTAWSVGGNGVDIYNSFDQFHFIWQPLVGDGSVSARVATQANTSSWAKAGMMLRQSTDAASPFYAALITPGNGAVAEWRAVQGGNATRAPLIVATTPIYLQVVRAGNVFSAASSSDGVSWSIVPGSQQTLNLGGSLLAGIAVTSHTSNRVSVANVDTVTFTSAFNPTATPSPSGTSTATVTNSPTVTATTTPTATSTTDPSLYTATASPGTTVTTDPSLYTPTPTITATASPTATSTTDPSLYTATASPSATVTTDPSLYTPTPAITATASPTATSTTDPSLYTATASPSTTVTTDPSLYTPTPAITATASPTVTSTTDPSLHTATPTATLGAPPSVTASPTATSTTDPSLYTPTPTETSTTDPSLYTPTPTVTATASATTTATSLPTVTATFTPSATATNSPSPTPLPGACPGGWTCVDIGSPGKPGTQTLSSGIWTVQGSGADIWNQADQFHFVWQSFAGDGSISARVAAQSNTDGWAKAGVMIRQSSDPGAPFYAAVITPSNGLFMEYRATAGAAAIRVPSVTSAVPAYLKLSRAGTTYSAYYSMDGMTWTLIPKSQMSLSLTDPVLRGLAVTSHRFAILGSATFDGLVTQP